jgi:hypothetical protein
MSKSKEQRPVERAIMTPLTLVVRSGRDISRVEVQGLQIPLLLSQSVHPITSHVQSSSSA